MENEHQLSGLCILAVADKFLHATRHSQSLLYFRKAGGNGESSCWISGSARYFDQI